MELLARLSNLNKCVLNIYSEVLMSVKQQCLVAHRIYICVVHKCILKRLHNSCSIFSWNWITKLTLVEFCRYAYLQRLYQILFNKHCFWIFNPELAFCMFHLMYSKGYGRVLIPYYALGANKNMPHTKVNYKKLTFPTNMYIKFIFLDLLESNHILYFCKCNAVSKATIIYWYSIAVPLLLIFVLWKICQ